MRPTEPGAYLLEGYGDPRIILFGEREGTVAVNAVTGEFYIAPVALEFYPDKCTFTRLVPEAPPAPLVEEVRDAIGYFVTDDCTVTGLLRHGRVLIAALRSQPAPVELNDEDEEVERWQRAFLKHGNHAGCHKTNEPHMHHGVDCDEPHACDCGFDKLVTESRNALIRDRSRPATGESCLGYPKCDGDLVGEPHSPECPMSTKPEEEPGE